MPGLTYLAAPYSAATAELVEQRMEQVARAQADLVARGLCVVTPLSCHWIARHVKYPLDWAHWASYSRTLLQHCHNFVLVTLPGWQDSQGVRAELEIIQSEHLDLARFRYDPHTQVLTEWPDA